MVLCTLFLGRIIAQRINSLTLETMGYSSAKEKKEDGASRRGNQDAHSDQVRGSASHAAPDRRDRELTQVNSEKRPPHSLR